MVTEQWQIEQVPHFCLLPDMAVEGIYFPRRSAVTKTSHTGIEIPKEEAAPEHSSRFRQSYTPFLLNVDRSKEYKCKVFAF